MRAIVLSSAPYCQLPIPKQSGLAGKFANGWDVSAIITYQSAFLICVQTQDGLDLKSSYFFEDANTPQVTGRVRFLNPKTNGGFWFDTSNISDPASGTFGNMPHSHCCGPPISNTDLAIERQTPVSECISTEFRRGLPRPDPRSIQRFETAPDQDSP